MEEWRGERFKTAYLPLVRPFSAVPDLLRRVRDAGVRVAIASSAKKDELDKYLDIARIADLVDVKTSSDDAEESKPAPDIFEVVLKRLKIEGSDAVAIGDTPYDASAAGKPPTASKSAEVDGRIGRSGGTQWWSQISNGELRESLFCGVFESYRGKGEGVPLSPSTPRAASRKLK